MKTKIKFYQDTWKDPDAYGHLIIVDEDTISRIEELLHKEPESLLYKDYLLDTTGAAVFKERTYTSKWNEYDTLYIWLNLRNNRYSPEEGYYPRQPEALVKIRKEPGIRIDKTNIIEKLSGQKTTKKSVYRYRYERLHSKTSLFYNHWDERIGYVPDTLILIPRDDRLYLELCNMENIAPRK